LRTDAALTVDPRKFLTEPQRRNVDHVTVIHAMPSWRLMQIALRVLPPFDIPNWMVQLVMMRIGRGVRPLESLS
jgi:hypothetical protein